MLYTDWCSLIWSCYPFPLPPMLHLPLCLHPHPTPPTSSPRIRTHAYALYHHHYHHTHAPHHPHHLLHTHRTTLIATPPHTHTHTHHTSTHTQLPSWAPHRTSLRSRREAVLQLGRALSGVSPAIAAVLTDEGTGGCGAQLDPESLPPPSMLHPDFFLAYVARVGTEQTLSLASGQVLGGDLSEGEVSEGCVGGREVGGDVGGCHVEIKERLRDLTSHAISLAGLGLLGIPTELHTLMSYRPTLSCGPPSPLSLLTDVHVEDWVAGLLERVRAAVVVVVVVVGVLVAGIVVVGHFQLHITPNRGRVL